MFSEANPDFNRHLHAVRVALVGDDAIQIQEYNWTRTVPVRRIIAFDLSDNEIRYSRQFETVHGLGRL